MIHKASCLRRFSIGAILLAATSIGVAKEPVEAAKPAKAPAVGKKMNLPAAFLKRAPTSVADLKAIEAHVQRIVPKLQAATVGVRSGRAQGSGVVISSDGYVLTAGHVSGKANRKVRLIFPDGKSVDGITLGAYNSADAGLMKITTPGNWPHVPVGELKDIDVGDWCLAMGHPGGFRKGRPPVVRLGRVIRRSLRTIHTDAVLVGGDSGGPLFDMHGRVIGINSRIGRSTTFNFHASIGAFSAKWDRMAKGEVWGSRGRRPVMGVNGENHPKGCKVTDVPEGYPAEKAGIKVGDIITKFQGQNLKSFNDLIVAVAKMDAGDKVSVEILRGDQTLTITMKLGSVGR